MGWQLLHIDSPVNQDGTGFPAPMLPTGDYKGLSRAGQKYADAYLNTLTFVDPSDQDDYKPPNKNLIYDEAEPWAKENIDNLFNRIVKIVRRLQMS